MRLESALFASREGLTSHGQAISVVGDDVANVNTVGYRDSRVEFTDLYASALSGDTSGVLGNVGSGSQLARVRQIHTSGVLESTNRSLDAGIDGDGFFIVSNGTDTFYTRAGNFSVDRDGNLALPSGEMIMGFAPGAEASGTLTALKLTSAEVSGSATTLAKVIGNLNSSEIAKASAPNAPTSFKELRDASSFISSTAIYDSLGAQHDVVLSFTKTASNTWTAQAYMDPLDTTGVAGAPILLGSANMAFGTAGIIPETSAEAAIIQIGAQTFADGGAIAGTSVDLSSFSQFASISNVNSVSRDGSGSGNVTGYEFDTDGKLYAQLDTESRTLIGTIGLADFTNLDGLERSGAARFKAGDAAGTTQLGTPGSTTFGKIQGGTLERSTVDLSTEFIDLVLYQRGYEANSQTLNATSQMIRDTIQLMR